MEETKKKEETSTHKIGIYLWIWGLLFVLRWWTDIASNWGAMDDTINLTFWIGGGVFVLVCLFMVFCVLKYSYKEGRKVEYKPEDHKLEKILTWATPYGLTEIVQFLIN